MQEKLKAQELIKTFLPYAHSVWDENEGFNNESGHENAKQCAIICCEEILNMPFNKTDKAFNFYTNVLTEIKNS